MSVTLIPSISVGEVTLTSGTGSYAITGNAITRCFPFADFLIDGDTAYFEISDGVQLEWVSGTYTSTTITRDSVLNSTNADMAIDWPASGQRFIRLASASETDSGATPLGFVLGGTTGQIAQYAATGNAVGGATVSGDATIAVGGTVTLATVGTVTPGAYTSTNLTVDAKGRITAAANGAGGLSSTLTSAHLFVGNGSNVATDVAITGDVTISNAGVTTIGSAAVTVAKGGTGIGSGISGGIPYYSGTGTIASSALLANTAIVLGGGVGAAPVTSADWTITTATLTGNANTSAGPGAIASGTYLVGVDGGGIGLTTDTFAAAGAVYFRRADTTNAAPSRLSADDEIARIEWRGWATTTTYTTGRARIAGFASQNWTNTTIQGAYIDVFTTPSGSATIARAARFQASGGLSVGTTTDNGIGTITANAGFYGALNTTLTSAHLYVGNGSNVAVDVAASGDLTLANTGAFTIAGHAISNAKMAQMGAHTFKGNNTSGTADAIDLTATQLTAELDGMVGDSGSGGTKGLVPAPASGDAAALRFLKADGTWATPSGSGLSTTLTSAHLYVGNGSNVATDVAASGDLTLANTGAFTIASHAVTNAKAAQMAAHTFKGNNTGSTADSIDLTIAQMTSELLGNSFVAFTGPASTVKTFTLPNASATVLTDNALVTVAQGGTGIGSGTSGGIPYYSGTGTIASSALLSSGAVLLGGGAGATPTSAADWSIATATLTGNANTSAGPGSVNSGVYLVGVDGSAIGATLDTFAAASAIYFRRADTTNAAPSRLSTDDEIGRAEWRGWATTTTYTTGRARIAAFASQNWTSATVQGAYIDVFTTPSGSATIARALRFQPSGGISIGNTTDNGIGTVGANVGYYVGSTNVTPGQLAATQSSPSDPTGTTDTTGLMMGLAGAITPLFTGRVQITICGTILNSASGNGAKVRIRRGTGTAPSNAGALAGTAIGSFQRYTAAASNGAGVPFSVTAIATGLSISTAYWIDVAVAAITGGTASIADVSISAMEF